MKPKSGKKSELLDTPVSCSNAVDVIKTADAVKTGHGCRAKTPSSPGSSDSGDKDKKRRGHKEADAAERRAVKHKKRRMKETRGSPAHSGSTEREDNVDGSSDGGSDDNDPIKPHRKTRLKSSVSKRENKAKPSTQKIKPNKFSGKGSVETFLAQFEVCAEINKWSENERAAQMKCCLTDEAATIIWDSGNAASATYETLVERLSAMDILIS